MHTWLVVAVFATVCLGMILGGLPRLRLDRTGVALPGAIAVVGLGPRSDPTMPGAPSMGPTCCCCSAPW